MSLFQQGLSNNTLSVFRKLKEILTLPQMWFQPLGSSMVHPEASGKQY